MPEFIEASLVRICTPAGVVVGAGFLAGRGHILTCAHVVAQASDPSALIAEGPSPSIIALDFPFLAPRLLLAARLVFWYPEQDDGSGDIAVLELMGDPPAGAEVARFALAEDVWEHPFRTFGFPQGFDDGVWATGRLLGRQAAHWIQIEDIKTEGFAVMPGFSGAPVWDTVLQGVVGMIVSASRSTDTKTAFVIPLDVLTAKWSHIELTTHPRIFLSASPAHAALAERLHTDLQAGGAIVWDETKEPTGVAPGMQLSVQQAIRSSQVIVLLASYQTRSSRQVKEHLRLADLYQLRLILVWVGEDEGSQPPLTQWGNTMWIDARTTAYEITFDAVKTALYQKRSLSGLLGTSGDILEQEPRNPYKSLHAFKEHDTHDFFGRAVLIRELETMVDSLLIHEPKERQGMLALIGASGSGKSSVVMAGLLPHLRSGGLSVSETWIYLDPIFPGNDPLETLALALVRHFPARGVLSIKDELASDPARALHLLAAQLVTRESQKVVLVVDQFEEVFTAMASEEDRQHFFDLLVTAATEPRGSLLVVLTLRADFYERLLVYPELYRLIDAHHVSILPMQINELRSAIERPAALPDVQLTFEGSLVGDILFEIQGQAGALPLLQFTLDQLFQRRDGQKLTLQAYHEIGGVKGALSHHAEQIYTTLPSKQHQEFARTLFLRLINPGVIEQDTTRRRTALTELLLLDSEKTSMMQEVADTFIRYRLLTTNEIAGITTLEVSHEALIREWARLAAWLHEAREDIRLQQTLSLDAVEWKRHGHPADHLYRKTRLADALAWATRNLPSRDEATFLQASKDEEQKSQLLESEQQRRELSLQHRVVSRQRWLVIALSLFSAAMLILASVTNTFRLQAEQETVSALNQAKIALAQSLSANARSALSQDKLDQALLLSVKALQTSDTYEARSSLLQALEYAPQIDTILHAPLLNAISTLRFTALKDVFVTSGSNDVYIWNIKTKENYKLPLIADKYKTDIIGMAPSPTDPILATVGSAGLWLWNIQTGKPIGQLPGQFSSPVTTSWPLAWSRDGKVLAASHCLQSSSVESCDNAQISLWNIQKQASITSFTVPSSVESIAFSPDGKTLAYADGNKAYLWNMEKRQLLGSLDSVSGANVITFSPDGKTLATAGYGGIQLWDVATKQLMDLSLTEHTETVTDLAFSPDGQILVSSSRDTTVRVWAIGPGSFPLLSRSRLNPSSREIAVLKSDPASVNAIAFSQDGKNLVSANEDGSVMIWDAAINNSPISHEYIYKGAVHSVVFAADDKVVLLGKSDGHILRQERETGKQITPLDTVQYPVRDIPHQSNEDLRTIQSLALSKDGRILATGRLDGTVILWNLPAGTPFAQFALPEHIRLQKVMLSADGQTVVASGSEHALVAWSVKKRQAIPLSLTRQFPVDIFALSPNGKFLAATSCSAKENIDTCNSQLVMWNIDTDRLIDAPTPRSYHISELVFSPDGDTLALKANSGETILWNQETESVVQSFSIPTGSNRFECNDHIVFNPNASQLLVYSQDIDTCFLLWDRILNEPFIQSNHLNTYGELDDVAFSPDGQHLATVGITGSVSAGGSGRSSNPDEGVLTIWDNSPKIWEQSACRIANRNLTADEWSQFVGGDIAAYRDVCPTLPTPASVLYLLNDQLIEADKAAQDNDVQKAIMLYQKLVDRGAHLKDADFDNNICWEGSTYQFALLVLPACENALQLVPDDANYHDSRGLARALTDDRVGAIADFQFFVDWYTANLFDTSKVDPARRDEFQQMIKVRKTWIQALKAYHNPFDQKTLQALRSEGL